MHNHRQFSTVNLNLDFLRFTYASHTLPLNERPASPDEMLSVSAKFSLLLLSYNVVAYATLNSAS